MVRHYFKVAFRNHTRHKAQSVITLLCLAVSFAFVSLATYWNHYEHTYDSFQSGYDKTFLIASYHPTLERMVSGAYFGLHSDLMNNYPEIEKACGVSVGWRHDRLVEINDRVIQASCDKVTPEAIDLFGIQWMEGNRNMASWHENEVAVSEWIAREVCGMESPVGKKMVLKDMDGVKTKEEYRIAAVFKTWPQHSNFDFHILKKLVRDPSIYKITYYDTYVRLRPEADAERFLYKLKADTIINYAGRSDVYDKLIPMGDVRLHFPKEGRNLSLSNMKHFVFATVLLAVCALLNYLTLFLSRLRNRGRDMALRTICGSSTWQTGALLMIEYLLLLFGALLFSVVFIELFFESFVELSGLDVSRATVYVGCGYLLLFILGLSAVLSLVPILYFKNKTLRVQIDSTPVQPGKHHFRGVCMQLFISLLFIFCSTVMIKQMHYLIYADINVERKNIAWIRAITIKDAVIEDILRQIPSVTEMVTVSTPIFPDSRWMPSKINEFNGRRGLNLNVRPTYINREIALFYGLRIKEGQESFDLKSGEFLINETLAKQLGDPNPIGKTLTVNRWEKGIIKGIVYDFQYQSPTEPARAHFFGPHMDWMTSTVAFKYTGDFEECKAAIDNISKNIEVDCTDREKYLLQDGETVYKGYLKKDLNFLKLLGALTIISVLIALFGVYVQILQECEHQRKNIAIRKVYGAQVKDILLMFFKEYMLQVAIAALAAFLIGYVLMKNWLEEYSRQTTIGIEVYLGIFVGMVILVSFCIGWHVWRAANENPATAVKKE